MSGRRSGPDLGGQAEGIRSGGTVRDDDLAALLRHGLYGLFDRRRPAAKPAFDGPHIGAAAGPDKLGAFGQARQGLVQGGPISEMQKALCRKRGSFRESFSMACDLRREFLTVCNGTRRAGEPNRADQNLYRNIG